MRTARLIAFVMFCLAYGAGALPAADAAQTTTIRHYDYPTADKAERDACIQREADDRGIPLDPVEYRAWFAENSATAEYQAWRAAVQHCQEATVWRTGKWDWDSRVLVRVSQS